MSESKRLINVKAVGLAIAVFTCTGAFAQPQTEAPRTASELSPATTAAPPTIYANHTPHPFGGRFAVFTSEADNLVPNDTNRVHDVFLQDTQTNTFRRLSVDRRGNQIPYSSSSLHTPIITPDGRFAVFESSPAAINKDAIPINRLLYWKDLQTGEVRWVNQPNQNLRGTTFSASSFAISSNGRFVAFTSNSRLTQDTQRLETTVFVRDMTRGVTTRIADGRGNLSISANGELIAFSSLSSNLVPGDTNNSQDIFVHNTQTRTTTRVSLSTEGTEGNNTSTSPAISPDGRFIAFTSDASNLVPNDTNQSADVFLIDLHQGTTRSVTLDLGATATPGQRIRLSILSRFLSFSPDSRFLLFGAAIRTQRPSRTSDYAMIFDTSSGQISQGPRIVRHP